MLPEQGSGDPPPTHFVHLGTAGQGAHGVVAVVGSQGLGEAKVTDLGIVPVDQQHVACRQVAVHEVLLLQVLHPHGHLVQQLCHIADGDLLPGVQGKAGSVERGQPGFPSPLLSPQEHVFNRSYRAPAVRQALD